MFLSLVKVKTASAHNSSLILWDETKSRGSVGESTVSRMAFCSFLTLKFLSHKYYLSKKSSIVQKKYINDTTILSRSNHCTVLMCPMRSSRCIYICSYPPPNGFPSRNITYSRVVSYKCLTFVNLTICARVISLTKHMPQNKREQGEWCKISVLSSESSV